MDDPKYLTEMLQVPAELDRLIEVIKASGATSYLEIGSKFGGSLWRIGSALPKGSRIVSIDLPGGTRRFPESERSLSGCITALRDLGYDARVLWGDSTAPSVVAATKVLGPYDVIFLDANHTLPYVQKDWANYSGMARKLFAFHDIAWQRAPEWKGTRIDVPQFWDTVKTAFEHEEIKLDLKNNGIGILSIERWS